MAQIPTVASPNLTPPPEMNPRIAGEPGRTVAQIGEQSGALFEFGEREASLLKKAQDEGIMLDAENKIGADIEHAHSELASWTDYTHADELKQKTADDLLQKYAERYGNRPDLWRHIQPYLARELNGYNAVVDRRATALTTDFNKGALYDSQLRSENEAAIEPTLEGKERIWAIQDAKTDAMAQNGSIRFDEAEVTKKMLRSRTIAAEVERAANPMNAPEIMEAEMNRLKEYEGKGYVDPKELEAMQEHLGRSYETALNRSDRIDVSRKGDAILSSLKNDPTLKDPETREFDPIAAAKKLDDNPDISTKVKKYAREELEQEAGVQNKLINDRDQKMLDDFLPKVDTGEMTATEIKRRENIAPGQPGWISRRTGSTLLREANRIQAENRRDSLQERALMRQERAEKSAGLAREILDSPGYLSDKSELIPYLDKGLSRADMEEVWKFKNLQGVKEYQDAYRLMKASPVYPNTDEGNRKLFNDAAALRQTVEAKKLTGTQIIDAASQMLKPKEDEEHKRNVKFMLDNIWPIARNVMSGGEIPLYGLKVPRNTDSPQPNEGDTKKNSSGDNVIYRGGKWQSVQ